MPYMRRIKVHQPTSHRVATAHTTARPSLATITIDFITGIPTTTNYAYDMIMVVVDRLSKYAHFIPCYTTCSAKDIAWYYYNNIVRLHGVPEAIISDRDV